MPQNLTISVDGELPKRARALARTQGTSLNALSHGYLENLVGEQPGQALADQLLMLMHEHGGRSGGRKIHRDELYEGRVGRIVLVNVGRIVCLDSVRRTDTPKACAYTPRG